MKKVIVTCALLASATLGAMAQNAKPAKADPATMQAQPPGPLSRPQSTMTQEERTQRFVENQARAFERQYGLTNEQYKGVYAACMEYTTKVDGSRSSAKPISHQEMENLQAQRDAKFKKIMNAQQYAQFERTRTRPVPPPQGATNNK